MTADAASAAATAFARSYGDAMELSLSPSTTAEVCAKALGEHYAPGLICFSMGHVITPSGPDFWPTGILAHLKRFEKSGLGWRIRLKKHRVEVLSPTSAACFLTWEIEPNTGEGWSWENIYGWRGTEQNPRGYWEYLVSDNEVVGLMQRVPNFMELSIE